MDGIVIKSIELVNFMCHKNLKVSFNKMITCIGGRNGSGKSAVMIALGIVFGQRIQSLERGNSLKELIRSGANQAIIKVVINNYKKYKYEKFGDSITIEKKIRDGVGKLSLYNSLGKIFNITKHDLEGIKDFYNLKFDNPLNFLTQEKSKKFLNVSKPEALYDFYYVGTEFKDIQEELEQSSFLLTEMHEKIKELDNTEISLKNKISLESENLKFLQYDPDLALKQIENEEKWIEIAKENQKIDSIMREIEEMNSQILSLDTTRDLLKQLDQENYVEKSTNQIDEEANKIEVQKHGIEIEINEYTVEMNNLKEKIAQIKAKDKREALETEITKLTAYLNGKRQSLAELEATREEVTENYQNEVKENKEKTAKIYNLKKQIDYFKDNAIDKVKKSHMENVRKIKQELRLHRFKDEIIGPIYEYVTLKEPVWYKPVSMILSKGLTNFIAFNSEDKKKLLDIFYKLNINYSVLQMNRKGSAPKLKKNNHFKSVFDVLDITNDTVSNCLVTVYNIEQIILIENREKAYKVIRSDPEHVDCSYIATGDKIKLFNGSLSDYRQKDDGFYWFEDRSTKIYKYEEEMKNIVISKEHKIKYDQMINFLGVYNSQIENAEKKLTNLQYELEALNNLAENDTVQLEKKQKILEKSLAGLNSKLKTMNEELSKLKQESKSITDENKRNKEEIRQKKENSRTQIQKIEYDVLLLENKKRFKLAEKEKIHSNLDSLLDKCDKRPEILRSEAELNRERLFALECKNRAKEMQSKDEIEKTIRKLEQDLIFVTNLKEKFTKSITETAQAYERRMVKKEEIKGKNTAEAIEMFKQYTKRSGYEGEMIIDHEKRVLDLKMKVHNSSTAGSKSTLSGGERSYASVCFLLSMWKCFKCPVKVLDEFDVFMDTLNRKNAIKALFDFFKENKVQVILITPLDTTDLVDPDCDIKVLTKDQSV